MSLSHEWFQLHDWDLHAGRGQGGKMLAVAACEEGQSVASASSSGSVHAWRVEYTSRSGGAPDRYTGIVGALPTLAHVLIAP
jgi:hypothetical protein